MPNTTREKSASIAIELPASAVDEVPLGIAKCDREGGLTYANQEMLRIAGLDDWRGRSVADIFRGDDLEAVKAGLDSRFEQRVGGQYDVSLTRPDDTEVPVRITGFPDITATGRVMGTLAIVRDLTIETAQRQMYRALQEESRSDAMLHAIAVELRKLVPFDRIALILLNEEETHLRPIYDWFTDGKVTPQLVRWWHIPEGVRPLLETRETLVIDDLPEWYRDPSREAMARDPSVIQFLEAGFVSSLSYPVTQRGARAATIGLYRKGRRPFTAQEQKIVESLPLAEAVSVALRQETEDNLTFLVNLMHDISSAYDTIAKVAQTIVDRISEHFEWEYVSIFQVHEPRGLIRMIAQKARDSELLALDCSPMGVGEGIVGHVFRTKRSVNVSDIASSPEFSKIFVKRAGIETKSELCIPIGGSARWLLNIEDTKANAFAPQEQRALETIARELSTLLERSVEYRYRSAIFTRANDAIILVDDVGNIVEANNATETLLHADKLTLAGRPVGGFIKDAEVAGAILNEPSYDNRRVSMLRDASAGGTAREEVRVLLSAAKLPDDVGGWVVMASDMTLANRVEELELSQDLYREVAGQVKTPMSLAIAWLRRLIQRTDHDGGTHDLAVRIMQQLQKVELTLDRMMLYEQGEADDPYYEVLIDVEALVEGVLIDLPESDRNCIRTRLDGHANVRGDLYALRYCLMTVLSYLLRLVPEDDAIDLTVSALNGNVVVALGGHDAGVPQDTSSAARFSQVSEEIALGEDTLRRLVGRNGGKFAKLVSGDNKRIEFTISLPVAFSGRPS